MATAARHALFALLRGLSLLAWAWAIPAAPRDWLLAAVPDSPRVVEGVVGGVATITLQNGLASRTFALVPTPPPPPPAPPPAPPSPCPPSCTGCTSGSCSKGCTCCANPGGRQVHGPNPGEVYPYFGKPCVQQSDCGQCALDDTCTCLPVSTTVPGGARCCKGKQARTPAAAPAHGGGGGGPAANRSVGFATIALSRSGHAGREHDTGAQLLRATVPEAHVVLDGVPYDVGGLTGQTEYAFLNTTLLAGFGLPAGAFRYAGHRTGTPRQRYAWTPGERFSDPTLAWPPRGITLEIDFVAPSTARASHRAVTVTVVYAMYANLPLYEKWVVVTNAAPGVVVVDQLTTDLLYLTNEAMGHVQKSSTVLYNKARVGCFALILLASPTRDVTNTPPCPPGTCGEPNEIDVVGWP